ncbi:MAG: efflux RND transporter periplasmic adaptor subunit [Burkholderiales bacterium]|nr:efflux RND transporter periplasmic adaptor subunit [Burkholderiales bacterium]
MNEPSAPPANPVATSDLQELLAHAQRPWWRRASTLLALLLLLAIGAGIWFWQTQATKQAAPQYITQPVARGRLAVTVNATGTLQPTRSVAVGSELSGTVARVLVDVNDVVKKGQLLVELDRAKLSDAVNSARAELQAARARREQAAATQQETRARLARLEEAARLSGGRLPAATELDSARAAATRAAADLAAAEANVAQASASLSSSQTNLAKSSIRSPIDGVVLARNVESGNAVAASLQAVTLFTLAEDLRSMKLSVNVDEADVAQLRVGQHARFTVAAQPGREYPATVTRVAFGSTTTDNVVTYTTDLDVDNSDLSLRPGMTANAVIATVEHDGVLLVPNSALRFTPTDGAGGGAAQTGGSSFVSKLIPRPPRVPRRAGTTEGSAASGTEGTLWVLRDGKPVALKVKRGLTDGRRTEVRGEGLAEGLAVIVDQAAMAK